MVPLVRFLPLEGLRGVTGEGLSVIGFSSFFGPKARPIFGILGMETGADSFGVLEIGDWLLVIGADSFGVLVIGD